jgi:hypothetical protein
MWIGNDTMQIRPADVDHFKVDIMTSLTGLVGTYYVVNAMIKSPSGYTKAVRVGDTHATHDDASKALAQLIELVNYYEGVTL